MSRALRRAEWSPAELARLRRIARLRRAADALAPGSALATNAAAAAAAMLAPEGQDTPTPLTPGEWKDAYGGGGGAGGGRGDRALEERAVEPVGMIEEMLMAAGTVVGDLGSGGGWKRCDEWTPVAIGQAAVVS